MNRVKDKVALVTGGSRGMGRAIATGLAREGAAVAVNYRAAADAAAEVVRRIEDLGGKAIAIQADVSKRDDVGRMDDTVVHHFGRVDILVNSAGVTSFFPLLEITEKEFDRMVAVNLKGVFLCTQVGWGVLAPSQGRL